MSCCVFVCVACVRVCVLCVSVCACYFDTYLSRTSDPCFWIMTQQQGRGVRYVRPTYTLYGIVLVRRVHTRTMVPPADDSPRWMRSERCQLSFESRRCGGFPVGCRPLDSRSRKAFPWGASVRPVEGSLTACPSAARMAAVRARTAANKSSAPTWRVSGRGGRVPFEVKRPGPSLVPLAPACILSSSASAALMEALARQERAALFIGAASTTSVSLPSREPRGVNRSVGAGSVDGRARGSAGWGFSSPLAERLLVAGPAWGPALSPAGALARSLPYATSLAAAGLSQPRAPRTPA